MINRSEIGWCGGVAVLACGVALSGATVGGQTRGDTVPRTAWGAPDLHGVWTGSSLTPLERPRDLDGRQFLTAEEAAALEARAAERRVDAPPRAGDPGTYNQFWFDPGTKVIPGGRTSLIVDPPDGRVPFTEAGRERNRRSSGHYGVGPRDSYVDLDTGERCLTDGLPLRYSGYNANYLIFQTPDHVAILGEMFRDLRIIPLDGRPPLDGTIRQWQGSSRGRWEGDTLVVETRGFNGAWTIQGSGPNARYVERIRFAGPDTLHYEFTADDPESFAGPWTVTFPITRAGGPVFENACHEGNYSMPLILRGARAEERERP